MRRGHALLTLAGAGVGGAAWWRTHPSAMPYWQRAFVELPHPLITRRRLRQALAVPPGSRVLEIGPGTGYYSVPVAEWLGPTGRLELPRPRVQDARAHRRPRAQAQPQRTHRADESFDAAYVVMALGEIPDQEAVLRELARVVRLGGRVVVGELALDVHVVLPAALARRAQSAGLRVERRLGPWFGSFTVLAHAR